MALEDKKLPPDLIADPGLIEEVERIKEADGTVSCAAAMSAAERKGVGPDEFGRTLDALSVRLSRCQIGTFGYPGHAKGWTVSRMEEKNEPSGLREALRKAAGPAQRISCRTIWDIADKFRVSRIQAGYAADRAGLKIIACQLGAF